MKIGAFLQRNGAWIALFLIAVIVSIMTDGAFLSGRNLTNLLRQTAINGILAAGMTWIILTGGIDLSVGSVVALAGVAVGISQVNWDWQAAGMSGALLSTGLALGVGLACGAINGGLVSLLGIPPFVITLGMMVVARGLAMIFSGGNGISPMGETLQSIGEAYLSTELTAAILGIGILAYAYQSRKRLADALFPLVTFAALGYAFLSYKGLPALVLFLLATVALTAFLLRQTTLGRSVYAIGSNEQAAFWAGVPVRTVKWIVYGIMGLLSGLAGVLLTARLNGAVPSAGGLFELDAIAAVVIGGTSLKGGSGTAMGAFVGALTIATLNNGMDLLGVPSFYQMVLKGIIVILAVALDRSQRQR